MSDLVPQDHAEAIALFRSEIVGSLTRRELDRGELSQALAELSQQRFRPPRGKLTKTYSVATLERWYYAYKSGGIDALRPSPRSDRGRCRDLTPEQRTLLAAIREEHPSASVPVILRTLIAEGRIDKDAISASSVRRFYQEQGLDRVSLRSGNDGRGKVRLRWQAERPGALWHADVCHGAALVVDGKSQPVRIHGILDDASRYVLALTAHHTEREIDMLGLRDLHHSNAGPTSWATCVAHSDDLAGASRALRRSRRASSACPSARRAGLPAPWRTPSIPAS